jgi:hypothetical protein
MVYNHSSPQDLLSLSFGMCILGLLVGLILHVDDVDLPHGDHLSVHGLAFAEV